MKMCRCGDVHVGMKMWVEMRRCGMCGCGMCGCGMCGYGDV